MKVLLYTTLGCHLCEQALAMLQHLAQTDELQIESIEIADDDELMERYGIRIPVVRIDDGERDDEIGWPFTIEALSVFLQQAS